MSQNSTRVNKNNFDLVITDVHMPDMDGFKFLELVRLEMDIPVLMLSVNGDPKMVMKGITHGACDYLLKPVRVSELQNIWQHVTRKKKTGLKEGTKTCNQDTLNSDSVNGQGSAATANSDQYGKPSKKRNKDGNDSEDPSVQKKPRGVWSVELHQKFIAAVNQLGIDTAVPNKIHEMMNVDKLTMENVATHLEKFRLYLKRISCVANQQANMGAAVGSVDLSSLQTILNASGQFYNNAFRAFTPDGMISRMNTPFSLNVQGLPSIETLQLIHPQNLNNSTNGGQLKFHGNQNDQMQHNKGVIHIQNQMSGLSISNNASMSEVNPQNNEMGGVLTSFVPQQNSQFSLPLMDNGWLNDVWSSVHSSGKTSYPTNEHFGPASMTPPGNMNLAGASSVTSVSTLSPDSLTDMFSQGVTITKTPGQKSSNVSFQKRDNHDQNGGYSSHVIGNDSRGSVVAVNGGDPEGHASINPTFNFGDPLKMKHDEIIELTEESSLKPHNIMNQQKRRSRL